MTHSGPWETMGRVSHVDEAPERAVNDGDEEDEDRECQDDDDVER